MVDVNVQCLHGRAERDQSILIRILERFCNLKHVPMSFSAHCTPDNEILIDVVIADMPPTTFTLIVAKIREYCAVLDVAISIDPHIREE